MKEQNRYRFSILFLSLFTLLSVPTASAQESRRASDINTTWLVLQTVPNFTWTGFPNQTNYAFEWEVSPVVYSFGMNKIDAPFHLFMVTPLERFAGSIELNASIQLFTSKAGSSHWGFSGQLLTHLPLIEKGENLGLNLGVARYTNSLVSSNYIVFGFSTLFGFLNYNIKYCPADKIWMHAIEFRFF